jgi:Restriction endonuclease NaeI
MKPAEAGGELDPLPGQLALPGMPDPAPEPGAGQAVLPGLEDLRDLGQVSDPELAAVAAELTGLDADGSRTAAAIRGALDMLLDGQHTGRYRWEQLHKTEKTHAGTLVEIALARSLRLADGTALDYTIAGVDVDCKFSHRLVRDGGGARDALRAEGIVIFGDYAGDQLLASALDLPRPGPGEFVSARLVRRSGRPDGHGPDAYARSVRLDGADWLLASPADPVEAAPVLPR